jgi:hypothetical protein
MSASSPSSEGRGYVDDLLARPIATLTASGAEVIRADSDTANVPMAKAFSRAGFAQFMTRTEYMLTAADLRRRASA